MSDPLFFRVTTDDLRHFDVDVHRASWGNGRKPWTFAIRRRVHLSATTGTGAGTRHGTRRLALHAAIERLDELIGEEGR